jgi:hypothetical protein
VLRKQSRKKFLSFFANDRMHNDDNWAPWAVEAGLDRRFALAREEHRLTSGISPEEFLEQKRATLVKNSARKHRSPSID